jgi:hypothetical protein
VDVRTAQRLRVEGFLGRKSRISVAFVDSKPLIEYLLAKQQLQRIVNVINPADEKGTSWLLT